MKPLPENRVWPAVLGNLLDGRQFTDLEFEARAGCQPKACGFSLNRSSLGGGETRASDRAAKKQERPRINAGREEISFRTAATRRQDDCERPIGPLAALDEASRCHQHGRQHDLQLSGTGKPTRMSDRLPGFATLAVHAGAQPDPTTGARVTPDLSDHVIRVQRRRSRRIPVRPAGIRQHLHPHHQPDHFGAGKSVVAALEGGTAAAGHRIRSCRASGGCSRCC